MKKIKYIVLFLALFIMCGCNSQKDDIVNDFINKVDKSKSYNITGYMMLKSGEDSYKYNLEVLYKADNYYKVKLVNENNGHEQIILKNDDGTYVVTPALNKSFNFQSEWPNNSSQSYILKSIVKDIKSTNKLNIKKNNKYYLVKANVDYPNNSTLINENIYFNDKGDLKKVEVLNKDGNTVITMKFNKINYKSKIDIEEFKLENLITVKSENEDSSSDESTKAKETSILDNLVYPLYLPEDTHLKTKDTVETNNGDRVIMTYTGSKPFMIIEEMIKPSKDMEVTSVYGEPLLLSTAVAALGDNSLEWCSNNINYYISSSYLSSEEMMTIAESLNTASVVEITNDK